MEFTCCVVNTIVGKLPLPLHGDVKKNGNYEMCRQVNEIRIILSQISQIQKDKYCIVSLTLFCAFNRLKELKTQESKKQMTQFKKWVGDLHRKFSMEE